MTDVELIKSKIDIADFLSNYIQLKKAGRNFRALCPFHSEKTPSFFVSPERQSWHCFGACAEGGDVVKFLEKWEHIDFLEALKILAQKTGVKLSNYTPTPEGKMREKLYEINHLAAEFYHYLLLSHRLGLRAKDYLKNRGIREETMKTFTLGYAPANWDNLLRFLSKKGYAVSDIHTAGLVVKSEHGTYYDRFRSRVMFTLRDHRGNTIGFAGRKLPPENDKEAKYINTAETPVYRKGETLFGLDITKEAIKKEKEAVLVEGELDMLSSFQSGVANVVAIKGSALTEEQTLLLKRYTENLILALDSDFAGNEAAKRGIEIAENAGLSVKVVRLAFGKDPAECIEKDPYLWKDSVKKSVPIIDFIIENAFGKYGSQGVIGKKKIGSEVIPFLSKIGNPILASHYTKLLAKRLEVAEDSINMAVRQYQKKERTSVVQRVAPPQQQILRETRLEEHLISLVIQSDDPQAALEKVLVLLTLDDFNEFPVKKIIEQLMLFLKTHKKFNVRKFGEFLTPEVIPTFDRVFLQDISAILADEEVFTRELTLTAKEIKKKSLRRSINNLSTNIRRLEDEEKEKEVDSLRTQMQKLLVQMKEVDKSSS